MRAWFSKRPILYALVGGVGIVLFWRGVWHAADAFSSLYILRDGMITFYNFADGIISLIIGSALLLSTGLFVSDFIGAEVISAGLKGEERMTKKVEREEEEEEDVVRKIHNEVHGISRRLKKIEDNSKKNK